MFDYADLKELARATGCRVTDLLVLAQKNDPFYAGQPARFERAEWFADAWQRFGFRHGAHLRRIHYVLVSQPEPVRWPDGTPYENTETSWSHLVGASLGARYLGLIPDGVLVDRRNPEPMIFTPDFEGAPEPNVLTCGGALALDIPTTDRLSFSLPYLHLSDFHRDQDYVVEVWCEKSTQNDILVPLARRRGVNLVTGLGEMSETAARLVVDRTIETGKPTRILYCSDFDPAGRSMPVAVARKIEFRLHHLGVGADIQLHSIVLTPEQCAAYRLPRTPIKDTERRAGPFEDRFGAGATELDALEALHPGDLAKIVTREVERFIDPTLYRRVLDARLQVHERLQVIMDEVSARHADEIKRVSEQLQALADEAARIEAGAEGLWLGMRKEMSAAAQSTVSVTTNDVPVPRHPEPIEAPLYDSRRGYLEQLDHYRA